MSGIVRGGRPGGRWAAVAPPVTAALLAALFVALLLGASRDSQPRDGRDGRDSLDLPRIPWEGGPGYWKRFANAADWTDPGFFPIGVWFSGVSSDEEVAWDRAHGIDFYLGMWEGTDFGLFERGGVYWVGGRLNDSFDDRSRNWPGIFLDDEVDGRFDPDEGLGLLRAREEQVPARQFSYANYTQAVIGPDLGLEAQQRYVNLPDVVSLDMYWYTIPFCDWSPYRGGGYADPVPEATCRTASSYGRAMNGLTERDSSDGSLHPRWMLIENLNGLSGQEHVADIEPGQLEGAAMSAIINEARGLVWFNQSFTGPCQTSGALRAAQVEGAAFCGAAQIEAMGEINGLIHDLAPVLNTQSYEWDFGRGLDTMLKTHDGSAYVFAMTDGTAGRRVLTLPPGLGGEAEVIGEDRSLPVVDGALSDDFAEEYAFHVYRVPLRGGTGS